MASQPIPLRKVPLITKWSPEILADLLTKGVHHDGSYLLAAYEWIEDHAARVVSPTTIQETLRELGTATSEHAKIALIPASFFVWLDELEAAYQQYHQHVTSLDELTVHDAFDLDPATGPFQDLIGECPDYSSNPFLTGGAPTTKRELSKQQTAEKHALWREKAEELRREHPNQTESWIAIRVRRALRETCAVDTIRKNIRIR